jgi:uncharacterized protein (DUF305 family)
MRRRALPAALTVLTLALAPALAACGGEESSAGAQPEPSETEHNDADVAFATDMIPHHAQALAMVDLTLGRQLDPEVAALAEDIRAAQTPEIETMADWLTDWNEPIPETVRDHANAHSDDHGGDEAGDAGGMDDMPGMMSDEDMAELEAAQGAEFEEMFLEMMIEHHEGAVEMAETELSSGQYQPALDLAEQVKAGQESEIVTMEALLGD